MNAPRESRAFPRPLSAVVVMQKLTFPLLPALVAAAITPLQAQQRPAVSVEFGVGGGYGRGGGERENRNAVAWDALVGWRARPAARAGLLVAADLGWQGGFGDDAICHVALGGACTPALLPPRSASAAA